MIKKISILAATLAATLSAALTGYVYFSTYNPRPTKLQFPTQAGEIQIRWDKHGIPHIKALKSDEDAFFGLGYAHAHDRFWQMEFQRHVAAGRLSELFGKKALEKDKFLRTMGFYHASEQSWNNLDEETRKIVQHYTEGVNAYLEHEHLPLQIKLLHYQPTPWSNIDSICWIKMMAYDLQNCWQKKILNYQLIQQLGEEHYKELLPSYPEWAPRIVSNNELAKENLPHNPALLPTDPLTSAALEKINLKANQLRAELHLEDLPGKGSNNWVVSGQHTVSGKPMLANDPHLGLQAPAVWYLAELEGPHLHVMGATLPGVPGVIIGHNDHIAWGVTNINPDTQDIYLEANNTPLSIRHELIHIKNGEDLDYPVYSSEHGPIISDIIPPLKNTPLIALKWTAFLPQDTTPSSLIKLNYAQNWTDFRNALRYLTIPSQNFVYADKEGNIGYSASGLIPIRIAWSGEFPIPVGVVREWSGFIPFEQLPFLYNPADGIIVTANNAIVSRDYPYQITFRWQDPGLRAKRIVDLLHQKEKLSQADFMAIQLDTHSNLWDLLKPALLNTKPLDKNSSEALTLLKNWDGHAARHEQAETLFSRWYQLLETMPHQKIPFINEWNEPIFIQQELSSNGFFCEPNCQAYLSQTLAIAAKKKNTEWGQVHIAQMNDPGLGSVRWLAWIWNRNISTAGDLFSVNVGTYNSQFIQTTGASYRQLIDFSDLTHSLYIQPLGQSNNPFDPHYADLMTPWRNGEYITIS